jgi:hypothetical protein
LIIVCQLVRSLREHATKVRVQLSFQMAMIGEPGAGKQDRLQSELRSHACDRAPELPAQDAKCHLRTHQPAITKT